MFKKYKIAYQGMLGSYTQQAIHEFSKKNLIRFEPIACRSFKDTFETIDKETFLGLVPIENSTTGSVVDAQDLFLRYDFRIIGEIKIPINHCLLTNNETKLKDIKKVYSHPQALMQCSEFLEKNDIIPMSNLDTAISAEKLAKNPEIKTGVIASEFAAKEYGLKIIKKNFQNENNNTTRFLLVKKRDKKFSFEKKLVQKADKTSIIFETKSIPAALYKALGGFATNGVNLTKIESRPVPNKKFEYLFYIDFVGNLGEEKVKLALEELKFFSEKLVILGSYKRDCQ